MRLSIQLEPEETRAILSSAERLVAQILRAVSGDVSDADSGDTWEEASGADVSDADDVTPTPEPAGATVTPLRPVAAPEDAEAKAKAESDAAKVLHGRDLWLALIEVWRQGFGVEGAPQPDRATTLVRMLHMGGGPLLSYLRTKKGLTDATRDVLCEIVQRPLDKPIKREARLLAENIAQVCSFHAPHLTEMLEYTSEFHYIED